MSGHTPTPWQARIQPERFPFIIRDGNIHGWICDFPDAFGRKEAEANARLIVRAVNAHDDLVKALEKLRSYNVDIQAGRINYRPEDHIQVIEAALAKSRSA